MPLSQPIHAETSTLEEHEAKWADYLRSEACPPVLGLVPLEEWERIAVGEGR